MLNDVKEAFNLAILRSRNLKKKKQIRNGVMAIHSTRGEKNELVQIIRETNEIK